jgi:hypothetical protein
MSEEVNVAYYCPYCESESTLIIDAKSPSDYNIVDECCPNCDAQIEGGVIDKLAYDAVADHFSIQGGYVKDMDRDLD